MQILGVLAAVVVPVEVGARRERVAGVHEGRRHVDRDRAGAACSDARRQQHREDVGQVRRLDRHGTVGRVIRGDNAVFLDAGLDRIADEIGRRHGAERHVDRHASRTAGRYAHRQPEGLDGVVGESIDGHCTTGGVDCGVVDGRDRATTDDVLGVGGGDANVDRHTPSSTRGDRRRTQHGKDARLILRRDIDVAGCIDHAPASDRVAALDAGFDRSGQGVEGKHAGCRNLHRHAARPTDRDRCGQGKGLDAVVGQRLHRHAAGRGIDGRVVDRGQRAAVDDVGRLGHRKGDTHGDAATGRHRNGGREKHRLDGRAVLRHHPDVAACKHVTADDRGLDAARDGVVGHRAGGGDADRSGSADGHRNGGGHGQRIDDARIAQLDREVIDDRDAIARAVRQATAVGDQVAAVGQDVAVQELVRRGKRDRVVRAAHARGDVERFVVLQLDAELIDHDDLVGRNVNQAARVVLQVGVVGDDVAVGEAMRSGLLQSNGESIDDDDAVLVSGHETTGIDNQVGVIGDDRAVGEAMLRVEGQRVRAGVEIDIVVQCDRGA